jgi:hypothetical protein
LPDATFRPSIPSNQSLRSRTAAPDVNEPDQEGGSMTKVARNTWWVALLVLGLGSSELVAYQGVAPHALGLGVSTRVAVSAGKVVARDLSAFAMSRVSQAAGDLVLLGVKQTSSLYRLANCALATASGERCAGAGTCEAVMVSGSGCPACPACPARSDRVIGAERPAPVVPRRIVIAL